MQEKTELKLMLFFIIGYLLLFTIIALLKKNYEFLYYSVVASMLILVIVLYYKKMHLSKSIMFGLTLVGALHISGLNIYIAGTRLYDFWFIPNLFRYDHLVHLVAIFVVTFIVYNLLSPHLNKKIIHNKILLSIILILIASGVGTFNEILELGAVIFFQAAKQVGDYMNNALDLLFNFIGATIACFFLMSYHKKKQEKGYVKKR